MVKQERRTVIRLIETHQAGLFCKHYLYFGVSRLRTMGNMPKAKREYLALGLLKHFGIPSVEAAGWGARRGPFRDVRACFILTVKQAHALDFRAWLKRMEREKTFRRRIDGLLQALGGYFRTLHGEGFFLLRPNTRNILIQDPEGPDPAVLFLDQPYARFLRGPAAAWGQLKDLSTLLGGVQRHLEAAAAMEAFLAGYLPDPLGHAPEELTWRVHHAIQARESDHRLGEWGHMLAALAPVPLGQNTKKKVR